MESSIFPELLLKEIIGFSQEAVIITDKNRVVLFTSPEIESLLEYEPDALVQKSLDTVFLQEDARVLLPNICNIANEKGFFKGETLIVRKSGETLYARLTVYHFQHQAQDECLLWKIHDISNAKQIEKNIFSLGKLLVLGSVTGKLASEIRGHLLSLNGFASKLPKALPADDPLLSYASLLSQEISAMEKIIEQVEVLASLPPPDIKKKDILDLLQKLVSDLRSASPENGDQFSLKPCSDLGDTWIYMDTTLISQALENLVSTMREGAGTGGHIEIRLLEEEDLLVIELERFSAAVDRDSSADPVDALLPGQAPHMALRLSLIRCILEEQGGKLEIMQRSEHETVFRVILLQDRRQKNRTQLFS